MLDYEGIATSRLVGQFQDSPKFKALIAAIVRPLTGIENTLDLMKTDRWVDTAEGVQLDGVGYIVGEARKGRDDTEYRKAIKFRIFVNISKGTPLDLIRGLAFLTDPDDAQYIEQYPATAILFTNGPNVDQTINDTMQDISPAGISDVSVCVSYTALPFRFGMESPPAELFVNGDADYMEVDGSDLQVSGQQQETGGATLGGVVPSDLEVAGSLLEMDFGATLVVNDPNTNVLLGDYHLTGVFQ